MYLCVRVRVYVWGGRSWEKKEKREKRREWEKKSEETGEKRKLKTYSYR